MKSSPLHLLASMEVLSSQEANKSDSLPLPSQALLDLARALAKEQSLKRNGTELFSQTNMSKTKSFPQPLERHSLKPRNWRRSRATSSPITKALPLCLILRLETCLLTPRCPSLSPSTTMSVGSSTTRLSRRSRACRQWSSLSA